MTTAAERQAAREWLGFPATRLILGRLHEAGEKLAAKYDTAKTPDDFLRVQMLRSVLLVELPRIIEETVNEAGEKPRWRFIDWLKRRA